MVLIGQLIMDMVHQMILILVKDTDNKTIDANKVSDKEAEEAVH